MDGLRGLALLLLVAMGVLLVVGVSAEDAEGATITVPDDHPTIQEAIDNAQDWDTILIKDGTYMGDVVVWRPLEIRGESRDGTRVHVEFGFALLVVSNRVTITNLTINNSSDWEFAFIHQGSAGVVENVVVENSGSGIWVNRAHKNVFRNLISRDNHESGIYLDEAGDNLFENVVSTGNGFDGGRDVWGNDNTFVSCTFSNNRGHGFSTYKGPTGVLTVGLTLKGCTMSNNSQNGCDLYFSDHMTVEGCLVEDNAWTGIRVDTCNDTVLRGNVVSNFTRLGIAYVGRDLAEGCLIEGNRVEDTETSWSVIMARDSRDCIIRDNRVTSPSTPMSIYSMNDTEVIDNVLTSNNDNASRITAGLRVGKPFGRGDDCFNVNVTGCTVTGYTTGIVLNGGSRVFIRGCTVSDCDGDGIWLDVNEHIDMPMAGGSIEDCTLVGCGIYIEGMTGSTVEGNSIDGAVDGIFLNATQLPIKDNVFRENLIVDCTGWGLRFNMTNGTNRFFLNTLTGNTRHSTAAIDGDVFDDGSTYGNYWGDYEERYPDATAVGRVWDTPYAVGEGTVTDMFPLAYAYDTIDPVADAGEQQGGDAGSTYLLNGTGSRDNGVIVRYTWTFTYANTPVELEGETALFPFLLIGSYEITLEVEDAWGNTDTNTTMVHITDLTEPSADAGEDVEAGMGDAFSLNGSASSDNGIIVSWEWHIDPNGLDRVLEGVTATFAIEEAGEYPVVLRVTDEAGNWDIDDMVVTVLDTEAPVADAGRDFAADQWSTVTLSGIWSTDNVGVWSWTWTFTEDGQVVIEVGENVEREFPIAGTYSIMLNVSDRAGNWDLDEVVLTVRDTESPVADAGADIRVDQGSLVTLDGTGSTDNVMVALFVWRFAEGSLLKDLYGVAPSYTFDVPGEYEVELQAWDEAGNIGVDWVIVTVNPIETHREWVLGPFREADGALGGVRVEVTLSGTSYVEYTDDGGIAEFLVAVDDLVSPATVLAEKEGWHRLEFDLALDDGGDPTGTIPTMERKVDGGGQNDVEEEIDWLAWGLVIVLIIAFAGTLLYLSDAAKRADEE